MSDFASIGNVIFTRDDGESVPEFQARVREAVGDMGGGVVAFAVPEQLEWVDGLESIEIEGGRDDRATIGDFTVERGDYESVEDFHRRARELATAYGCGLVVFGGLPAMPV